MLFQKISKWTLACFEEARLLGPVNAQHGSAFDPSAALALAFRARGVRNESKPEPPL